MAFPVFCSILPSVIMLRYDAACFVIYAAHNSPALFHRCQQEFLQHANVRDTLVARLIIHTHILTNGREVVRRLCLGLHVVESKLLMAMTEHAVPLFVRGRNPSLNPEELAFVRVHDE